MRKIILVLSVIFGFAFLIGAASQFIELPIDLFYLYIFLVLGGLIIAAITFRLIFALALFLVSSLVSLLFFSSQFVRFSQSFGIETSLSLAILLFLVLMLLNILFFTHYRPKHEMAREETEKVAEESKMVSLEERLMPLPPRASLIEVLGSEVLSTQDFAIVLPKILDHIKECIPNTEEILFLVKTNGEGVEVKTAKGSRAVTLIKHSFKVKGSLVVALWEGQQGSLNIANLAAEQSIGMGDEISSTLARLGLKSLLMAATGKLGMIILGSPRLAAFTKTDQVILESIATQSGYILQNIEAHHQLEGSLEEANKLLELTSKLVAPSDPVALLQSTLEMALKVVKGDSGSIMLLDEKTQELRIKVGIGIPEDVIENVVIKVGEGIAGWVAKNRRPIAIRNFPQNAYAELPEGKILTSLCVPILLDEKLVGVLSIGSQEAGREFDEEDVAAVSRLVKQSAVSIESVRTTEALQQLFMNTVKALIEVIESRDPFARGHSENVTRYAVAIAKEMELSPEQVRAVEIASLLHDIGMASISENIFRMEKPLTTVERVLIKTHPVVASEVLKDIPQLYDVVPAILYHHERFDGNGYPEGLKGEKIPLTARILAVAEAYDAMTTQRAYRAALSPEEAVDELRKNTGTQFDPQIVYLFCNLLEKYPELQRQSGD